MRLSIKQGTKYCSDGSETDCAPIEASYSLLYNTMMLRYAVGCAIQVSCYVPCAVTVSQKKRGDALVLHDRASPPVLLRMYPRSVLKMQCMFESESVILYARRLVLDKLMLSALFGKSCREPWSDVLSR